jgi:site-specific DNA-methyltransferase (adenine-specific)
MTRETSPTTATDRPAGTFAEVLIRRITVAPGRRPVGDVEQLAASIAEVGRLLQPIVLNHNGGGDGYRLIAGMTRLEAVKLLGWKRVPANVVDLNDDAAELAELDENLARAELTAAQRARLTWRRQQAYERIHPDTRRGTAGAHAKHLKPDAAGGSASETVSLAESSTRNGRPVSVLPAGFAADTAARIGRTARTVQQDAQVGRLLGDALLDRVEQTPLADSKRELLVLARMEPKRRTTVLREIEKGGHAKVSHAEAALAKARRQRELRRRAKDAEHQGAMGRAKRWNIVTGDCLDVLAAAVGRSEVGNDVPNLPETLKPGSVRMVFADPPYDLGKDYGRGRADDRKGAAGYADFTRRWIALCADLLTPDGSLWVCIDHRCLRPVLNAVADADLHQRGVVTWADPFAQYQPRNFTPGRFLVYATKHPKQYVFHADAVAVPSKRQTDYADTRAHPAGRTPPGVWTDIGTLCGTFVERGEGMTQLPVALVERPLLACTDVDDLVLDPFGGEGTTAVAAERHGRRSVLIESDAARAERARVRVLAGVISD